MKIKDLPKVDMPREKLQKYGAEKLLDYELLAILLGSGIKGMNVLELSKKILKTIQKIGIKKITLESLLEIKGLGKAKASQIFAVLELGKRLNSDNKIEILSPKDVWNACVDFRSSKKEHFAVFYLDTQNIVLDRRIVSVGALNESIVHPREVFEPAIFLHSAGIIAVHNHPSGNLEPSVEDLELTVRLKNSGKLLGIEFMDHIVISAQNHKGIIGSQKFNEYEEKK